MTDIPGTRHRFLNRKSVPMTVWVDGKPDSGAPVAFIIHGFSGNARQKLLYAMTAAFRDNGYTTVTIDATNSFNSSGGAIENANWTSQKEDLADAIAWAATQDWYREPFAVSGHSLGGGAALAYAVENPRKVRLLAPVASLISKEFYIKALERHDPQYLRDWRERGHLTIHFNGKAHKRPWHHVEHDYARYDIVKNAGRLAMPVLLIAGEKDHLTPPWAHKILFDALPGRKDFYTVPGAQHNFEKNEQHVTAIMSQWIRKQDEKTFRKNFRPRHFD